MHIATTQKRQSYIFSRGTEVEGEELKKNKQCCIRLLCGYSGFSVLFAEARVSTIRLAISKHVVY